jgi:hypothetical protein
MANNVALLTFAIQESKLNEKSQYFFGANKKHWNYF